MAMKKAAEDTFKINLDEKKEELCDIEKLFKESNETIENFLKNQISTENVILISEREKLKKYKVQHEKIENEIKVLELKLTKFKPRSGSNWTSSYLKEFKIDGEKVKDFKAFFGVDPIQYDSFNEKVKELHTEFKKINSSTKYNDLSQLNSAKDLLVKEVIFQALYIVKKDSSSEREIHFFGYLLLAMFELRCRSFLIEKNQELDLEMSLVKTHADPDLMLRSIDGSIVGLLLKSKFYGYSNSDEDTAKTQLVAEIIAAYQSNKTFQKHQCDKQEIFGIILIGTLPKFYKIMVTDELANAVKEGRYPTVRTLLYELEFESEIDISKDAIFNESYRLNIIQSFLALKEIMKKLERDAF